MAAHSAGYIALLETVGFALSIYMWIIIARAVVSWIPLDQSNPTINTIVSMVYALTEPVLGAIRRRLPIRSAAIDISPLVALVLIYFLQRFLSLLMLG